MRKLFLLHLFNPRFSGAIDLEKKSFNFLSEKKIIRTNAHVKQILFRMLGDCKKRNILWIFLIPKNFNRLADFIFLISTSKERYFGMCIHTYTKRVGLSAKCAAFAKCLTSILLHNHIALGKFVEFWLQRQQSFVCYWWTFVV